MVDPLSVAASITGLISLAIEVTQSLHTYYNAYRGRDVDIDRLANKLEDLRALLQSISSILARRRFEPDENSILKIIERSIENCRESIEELQEELEKFKTKDAKGLKANVKAIGHRAAYPFKKGTLQNLDDYIREIRENISLAQDALHLRDSTEMRNDMQDAKALLDLIRSVTISKDIRDWLQAPDTSVDHNDACAKKHSTSGSWLMQNTAFQSWLERRNSFLWISGFAGTGKSVLCSTAIQNVFQWRKTSELVGIAFFYFRFGDASKQDVSALLRAVLSQLSSQLDRCEELNDLYSRLNGNSPSIPDLARTLQDVTRKFGDVYIFIDAVDESPRDTERHQVLEVLTSFKEWNFSSLHVLLTSRDLPDIREYFQYLAVEVSMKNNGVDKDIADYVVTHLEESLALRKWAAYHDLIEEALRTGARGVFRWVECQFKSIAQCPRSEAALKKRLSSLPQSLDETYKRMLLNIDSDWIEDARRILTLLCFSRRPLHLQEILDAAAVQTGENAGFDATRRFHDENDILSICPGLIDVNFESDIHRFGYMSYSTQDESEPDEDDLGSGENESGPDEDEFDPVEHDLYFNKRRCMLRIAHLSVQEYLESERILQKEVSYFGLKAEMAHSELTEICLVYLLNPVLSSAVLSTQKVSDKPFAVYAAENWFGHYERLEIVSPRIEDCLWKLFGVESICFRAYIKLAFPHSDDRFPTNRKTARDLSAPVYYASILGLTSIVSMLLADPRCKAEDSVLDLSMAEAASSNRSEIVELLLKRGTNVEARTYKGRTALESAVIGGYPNVVLALLAHGARINSDGQETNLLIEASAAGYKDIAQMLLDYGADIETVKGRYTTPLMEASYNGHKATVQLLLERGAYIEAGGAYAGNSLLKASFRGHEAVVKVLLENGACINTKDGSTPPLAAASMRGYEQVVQLLIEKGANLEARGENSETALIEAAIDGNRGIVQLLLEKGANFDARGKSPKTALVHASSKGHTEVVELLLDKGANTEARGKNSGTSLVQASLRNYVKIVSLLLKHGARITGEGGPNYVDALHAACFGRSKECVQVLLQAGADATHSTKYLQSASYDPHPNLDILRLLLTHGADAKDPELIRLADYRDNLKLRELLLAHGARASDMARKREDYVFIEKYGRGPEDPTPSITVATSPEDRDAIIEMAQSRADFRSFRP